MMRTIPRPSKRPRAFTLIELAVVIFIIGLLLSFVLVAYGQSVESARVRATQSLITKLQVGLEERLDALLQSQPNTIGTHAFLGSINTPTYPAGVSPLPWGLRSDQRALVIARIEQVRNEFPDVFFIDPAVAANPSGSPGTYPIRFGGLPYPDPTDASAGFPNYVYPIGNNSPLYLPNAAYQPGDAITNAGVGGFVTSTTIPAGLGINGASYGAAAGLNKLCGYTPKGCDGVDNNGDGYIDEYAEGMLDSDASNSSGTDPAAFAKFQTFVANHTHKTARAEMLYALLVEGQGPLGSVFSASDFRDSEIKDTDNDGVPEFVDGWGEPLQFYRWPVSHRSDTQKGDALYGAFEPRQLNPLDPNSQLIALPWWSDDNAPFTQMSLKCLVMQNLFGPMCDPDWIPMAMPQPQPTWDRSGATSRRAFATKFLIISGGPDRLVGIPRISDFDIKNTSKFTAHGVARAITGTVSQSGGSKPTIVPGESWAMKLDANNLPDWAPNPYIPDIGDDDSLDDISNQNIQNKSGGFQ